MWSRPNGREGCGWQGHLHLLLLRPDTWAGSGGRAQGERVIHWVSATPPLPAEVRLCDRLFQGAKPGAGDDSRHLNPDPGDHPGPRWKLPWDAKPEFAHSSSVKVACVRHNTLQRRTPGVQPHRGPARRLGQGRSPIEGAGNPAASGSGLNRTQKTSMMLAFFNATGAINRRACRSPLAQWPYR